MKASRRQAKGLRVAARPGFDPFKVWTLAMRFGISPRAFLLVTVFCVLLSIIHSVPDSLLSDAKQLYLQKQEEQTTKKITPPVTDIEVATIPHLRPTTPPTLPILPLPNSLPDWLSHLYTIASAPPPADTFVIAHCFYTQQDRQFDPLGQSGFFSHFVGPYISPNHTRVEYRRVVALERHLHDKSIVPSSPLGLVLLGLSSDVHLRVCSFGSTEIMKLLLSVPGVTQASTTSNRLQAELRQKGLWVEDVDPDEVPAGRLSSWSHGGFIHWPASSRALLYPKLDGKPFGPFIPRFNKEPWFESVSGVTAQFDTKRTELSVDSVTVWYPMILDTMSWRLTANEFPNHWSARVGFLAPHIQTIQQALTRPHGFVPNLAKKAFWMTSINSHCAGPGAYMKSVAVRELFAFAVHTLTSRPVHFLGNCPTQGRDRGGKREAGASAYRMKSALEAMAVHKFAIVFENSKTSGYFTEKIVNAYLAEAVPIYFGPSRAQVERVLNVKAFIHCDLPNNLTDTAALNGLTKRVCQAKGIADLKSQACHEVYVKSLNEELWPHFEQCVGEVLAVDRDEARYLAMLGEPLMRLDGQGEPLGVWSGRTYGMVIRTLMEAFGYKL